ncbi:MAG: TetR-like C-terminal domain-containing protein [Eubacteriales bacterium]|nr:TetR-like C-terminal domain-containing protein [Eubacteriales bacterium]
MPPKVKFSKEAVTKAALQIARKDGMDAVNARAIAAVLGCSTQPLFREFQSMEQLKGEVRTLAMGVYEQYILRHMVGTDKPYKASGMAYLHFAKEEPRLFQLLFMYEREKEPETTQEDHTLGYILETLQKSLGLTEEQARRFHLYSWIYVHGMASMIATNYIVFSEEDMDGLLTNAYLATKLLFEREKESLKQD